MPLRSVVIASLVLFAGSVARAENEWPQWRGPAGTGAAAPDASPPTEWSEAKNVRWKVKLPGAGSSTPIVTGDRIFIQTAVPAGDAPAADAAAAPAQPPAAGGVDSRGAEARGQGRGEGRGGGRGGRGGFGGGAPPTTPHRFVLLCIDRNTGKTLWEQTARARPPRRPPPRPRLQLPLPRHRRQARLGLLRLARTPLLRPRRQARLGERPRQTVHPQRIRRRLLPRPPRRHDRHQLGSRRRRRLHRRLRQDDRRREVAAEAGGADELDDAARRRARRQGAGDRRRDEPRPRVRPRDGQGSLALPRADDERDPHARDGRRHRLRDQRVPRRALLAVKLGREGDLTGTDAILWSHEKSTPYVPSPLLAGDRLYLFSGNNGILSCFDVKTGKPLIDTQRIDGLDNVYASPVFAGGHLYFVARDGTTVVMRHADGGQIDEVAVNDLDDPIDASPAVVGKELLLRGKQHLYCIAE